MFLDTSGLLTAMDGSESQHDIALDYFLAAQEKRTHNYVIAELVALATTRRFPRRQMFNFILALKSSTEVDIITVDSELHRAAFDLLRERPDKEWSLCDAVSFVLMKRLAIREALTTDHHFEQAGFARLLKG